MAQETRLSAEMITGDMPSVHVITMGAMDGLDKTKASLSVLLEQHKHDKILIVVDLLGGTPCNVANMLCKGNPNIRILTGLNLAMLIDYALTQEEDLDALSKQLYQDGIAGITLMQEQEDDCDIAE